MKQVIVIEANKGRKFGSCMVRDSIDDEAIHFINMHLSRDFRITIRKDEL